MYLSAKYPPTTQCRRVPIRWTIDALNGRPTVNSLTELLTGFLVIIPQFTLGTSDGEDVNVDELRMS